MEKKTTHEIRASYDEPSKEWIAVDELKSFLNKNNEKCDTSTLLKLREKLENTSPKEEENEKTM